MSEGDDVLLLFFLALAAVCATFFFINLVSIVTFFVKKK
jgi:hypothetical protein